MEFTDHTSRARATRLTWAGAASLGIIAYMIVIGPSVLNPLNDRWLRDGDLATYYLGWQYFRASPWSWPLGANPNYGLDISSSLLFSDSNPLFAFLFRPFAAWLPEPFQYFGLWILLCFVAQTLAAAALVSLFTPRIGVRLLLVCLLLFTPSFLSRITGHISLGAHFFVLAALYLALNGEHGRKHSAGWVALLGLVTLVHLYLMALVAAIWSADVAGRWLEHRSSHRSLFMEVLLVIGAVLLALWIVGFFLVGVSDMSARGLGVLGMNLLSPIMPQGWSFVSYGADTLGFEGFNYLGIGTLILVAAALPHVHWSLVQLRNRPRLLPLFSVLMGLALLSLSSTISVGDWSLDVPLPWRVQQLLSAFRASGRFFWPMGYAIVLWACWVVIRRYPPQLAFTLVVFATLIQAGDTSAGWLRIKERLTPLLIASEGADPLTSRDAAELAGRYRKLRSIAPINRRKGWEKIARFAQRNGLGTDSVYLARVDGQRSDDYSALISRSVAAGVYEPDSLYLVRPFSAAPVAMSLRSQTDALLRMGRHLFLAPGWLACSDCPVIGQSLDLLRMLPTLDANREVRFGDDENGLVGLLSGWRDPDPWGTRVLDSATEARLLLKVPNWIADSAGRLNLRVRGRMTDSNRDDTVQVSLNGQTLGSIHFPSGSDTQTWSAAVPRIVLQSAKNGVLTLSFLGLSRGHAGTDVPTVPDFGLIALRLAQAVPRSAVRSGNAE